MTVESVRMYARERLLFADAALTVAPGERIGLTGRNGSGKSTLLACLAGQRAPHEGQVRHAPGMRLAHLPQGGALPPAGAIDDVIAEALAPLRDLERELREAERTLVDEPAALERYGELLARFEDAGGYDGERRVVATLDALGFPSSLRHRELEHLSDGERQRLAVAVALASGAELLLLDEPTTHLDLDARAYLARRLREWSGAIVVATHDRALLRDACTRIVAIEDRRLRTDPDVLRATPVRRTRGGRSRSGAGDGPPRTQASPSSPERPTMLRAERLTIAGDAGHILADAWVDLEEGDVVALLGPNGTGKSTLLAMLAGERPSDDPRSRRTYAPGARVFWMEPGACGLRNDVAVLRQIERFVSAERARQLLALAGVPARAWFAAPSGLSGGERARAGIALLMAAEANLVFLDEPETHLDLEGIALLESVIVGRDATVVLATHDRVLAENVATRVIALERGSTVEYDSVREYLERDRDAGAGARAGRARPPVHGDPRAGRHEVARAAPPGSTAAEAPEPNDAVDALEDERARLEATLLDPLALPERERARVERRLADVIEELAVAYDRRLPPAPPRIHVREGGVRFGAVAHDEGVEVVGPRGVRGRIRRSGAVAHAAVAPAAGAELLPWALVAFARAAKRLAFYTLGVTVFQMQSVVPLDDAGLLPAGDGWWIQDREAFEAEEGWGRDRSSPPIAR